MKPAHPLKKVSAAVRAGLRPLALATAVVIVAGCSMLGYTVGSTLPSNLQTIYVPTFENASGEPQLEAETTAAAVREFQKDGTLRVVKNETEADLVLSVKLAKYTLEPLRYSPDQAKKASEYRLLIDARLECVNRQAGTVMVTQSVQGKTDFIPSGGITLSKQEALPAASADLAHKIVKSVVEAW